MLAENLLDELFDSIMEVRAQIILKEAQHRKELDELSQKLEKLEAKLGLFLAKPAEFTPLALQETLRPLNSSRGSPSLEFRPKGRNSSEQVVRRYLENSGLSLEKPREKSALASPSGRRSPRREAGNLASPPRVSPTSIDQIFDQKFREVMASEVTSRIFSALKSNITADPKAPKPPSSRSKAPLVSLIPPSKSHSRENSKLNSSFSKMFSSSTRNRVAPSKTHASNTSNCYYYL